MTFFYAKNDEKFGPVSIEELKEAGISRDTLVWREGFDSWKKAGNIPELAELFKIMPPPLPKARAIPPPLPTNDLNNTQNIKVENENTNPIQKQNIIINNKKTEDDIVYYSDNQGVKITSTRFIVESSTYPLQGITSITTAAIKPSRVLPIILGLAGVLLFIFIGLQHREKQMLALGGFMFVISIIWLILLKDRYSVRISTSAAQTDAVVSKNQSYINDVARALNDAFIQRGF